MAKGKGKVFSAVVSMAGEISPTLGKSLGEVQKKLDGVNLKAVAVGGAIGTIATATAVAVGKATKYLAELGDSYNQTLHSLSASTGLAGAELDTLGESMQDIYANGFGESMQDVSDGLSQVYRTTGLVDDELQKATESGFALQKTFGYDVSESAVAAAAMMKNFGVSADEAYNLIALGAQNGADQNGDMLDVLNEYSAQYAALGLSADQFTASLISGSAAGVFQIDKVGDAVKEFNIRSKDMSDSSAEAYATLGLDADTMFQKFAAGGDTARDAMFEVISAIENTEDATKKNAAGVALFGTQYEDLESNVLPVLASMQDATYESIDVLGEINKVQYDNLEDAFEGVRRKAEKTLLPIASVIADSMTEIVPIIGDVFDEIGPIIEQVTRDAMPFVKDFLGGIKNLLPQIMPMITQLANAILPLLSTFVQQLLPPLLDLVMAIIPPMIEIISVIMPPLIEILLLILPMVTELVNMILPVILEIITALLPLLQPLLDIATMLFNTIIMPLMEPMTLLVEALLPVISPILEAINAVLAPLAPVLKIVGDVLGVIVGAIAKVIGWISSGFKWLVDLIFGDKDKAEEVSAYAAGGFTDGVSIAGEAGTEAIISFDPAYRSQNLSYWAKAGQMLGADASDYNLGTYSVQSVNLGGIEFSPEININGNADKQDIIDAIEEAYPDFLDLLERALADKGVGAYV